MSRYAWKLIQPASLAVVTLLAGCNSPLFAKLMGRQPADHPTEAPAASVPAPADRAAAVLDREARPAPWRRPWARAPHEPAHWRLVPLEPRARALAQTMHTAPLRPPPAHRALRPVHLTPPVPLRTEPAASESPPLARSTPAPARTEVAQPVSEGPTLIQPVPSSRRTLPDPASARGSAPGGGAKPAGLAPKPPSHPATLRPVHKALPGTDTTPY